MQNFSFHNPVRIEFGAGTIAKISKLIPHDARIMLVMGGGSIQKNGVHAQVVAALGDRIKHEFWGIEPNPRYETSMRAVEICRTEKIDYLLSVGGGSVLDATKFIAAATPFEGEPWDILKGAKVKSALALACILTLPATGSEMNSGAVISRESTQEKLYFGSPKVYPRFSILDPETTLSLPARQTANGIVDTFVHVLEQYANAPSHAPLQDRQAEAILATLLEEGPKLLENPSNRSARANVMWCATQALNGVIGLGVPQDWATHDIGHEITALHGLDHAQTLAIIWPGVAQECHMEKQEKLAQMGRRLFALEGDDATVAKGAIHAVEQFFLSLGMAVRLGDYGIDAEPLHEKIAARYAARNISHIGGSAISMEALRRILLERA